jgi:hypothetical protein
MTVFKKPIQEWTSQDHKDEIIKRKLITEKDLGKSTSRWQKYINTKIGIGKEFEKILKEEISSSEQDDNEDSEKDDDSEKDEEKDEERLSR